MSSSKSKKKLNHKLRNGLNVDPRELRGSWNGVKPVTRVKENKRKDVDYNDRY